MAIIIKERHETPIPLMKIWSGGECVKNMASLNEHSKILIIKPSSLGDIIHTLPALRALRARYPKAWIAWLVKQEWQDLLVGHPDLSQVISVGSGWVAWVDTAIRLRSMKFDVAVDFQGLFRTGMMSKLSGAPMRVGFADGREGSPMCYTHRVKLPLPAVPSWRLMDMHAVDRNLLIVKSVGADISHPRFVLPDADPECQQALTLLQDSGWIPGEPVVAMAPLTRAEIKNWPLGSFLQTAKILRHQYHCWIVLLGTASQQWIGEKFRSEIGSHCIDLLGKTTLRQLAPLIQRMNCVIANDSAVMHIAAAVGIPVIAMMGPTNPRSTGPYGSVNRVHVNSSLACRPCGRQTCRNTRKGECLTSLSVDEVVKSAGNWLPANACLARHSDK